MTVTPGLFDDAAGLVQVTGTGLTAGQHVVVPARMSRRQRDASQAGPRGPRTAGGGGAGWCWS